MDCSSLGTLNPFHWREYRRLFVIENPTRCSCVTVNIMPSDECNLLLLTFSRIFETWKRVSRTTHIPCFSYWIWSGLQFNLYLRRKGPTLCDIFVTLSNFWFLSLWKNCSPFLTSKNNNNNNIKIKPYRISLAYKLEASSTTTIKMLINDTAKKMNPSFSKTIIYCSNGWLSLRQILL